MSMVATALVLSVEGPLNRVVPSKKYFLTYRSERKKVSVCPCSSGVF